MTDSSPPAAPAFTLAALLRDSPALRDAPSLAEAASRLFEFTQFLLDRDENLTRTGALNGEAREQLRGRILELVGESPGGEAGVGVSEAAPGAGPEPGP